jgi:hypothetical protein
LWIKRRAGNGGNRKRGPILQFLRIRRAVALRRPKPPDLDGLLAGRGARDYVACRSRLRSVSQSSAVRPARTIMG